MAEPRPHYMVEHVVWDAMVRDDLRRSKEVMFYRQGANEEKGIIPHQFPLPFVVERTFTDLEQAQEVARSFGGSVNYGFYIKFDRPEFTFNMQRSYRMARAYIEDIYRSRGVTGFIKIHAHPVLGADGYEAVWLYIKDREVALLAKLGVDV